MRARLVLPIVALLAPGCSDGVPVLGPPRAGGQGATGHGVLLIAIDSLRADHLSSNGYDRETTPVLDELAAEGVAFTQAFSTAPWLLPAHVSVLTGCDPYIALRPLPENIRPSMVTLWHVPDLAPRLSKEFLRNGYATAAFSDHPWVAPVHGFRAGFKQFFEHSFRPTPTELGIEGLARRVEQWLRNRPRDQNWFAYLHLHDLERIWRTADPAWDTYFQPRDELAELPPVSTDDHTYFAVPRQRWDGGLHTIGQYEAKYDGAVRKLDTALGRLFTRMRQMERWETTTVVVVGTYGVGFGEEGILLDHGALAEVDLHVPFLVRPGAGSNFDRGLRTDALASLLDVAPTLLEMRGLGVPAEMQGVSLVRAMRGDEFPREFVIARCGFQAGYVIMDERWCYLRTFPWAVRDPALALAWYGNRDSRDQVPRVVLHDRTADPGLRHIDGGAGDAEVGAELRSRAEEWLARVEGARRRLQAVTWPTPEDPRDGGEWLPSGGSPGSPP